MSVSDTAYPETHVGLAQRQGVTYAIQQVLAPKGPGCKYREKIFKAVRARLFYLFFCGLIREIYNRSKKVSLILQGVVRANPVHLFDEPDLKKICYFFVRASMALRRLSGRPRSFPDRDLFSDSAFAQRGCRAENPYFLRYSLEVRLCDLRCFGDSILNS